MDGNGCLPGSAKGDPRVTETDSMAWTTTATGVWVRVLAMGPACRGLPPLALRYQIFSFDLAPLTTETRLVIQLNHEIQICLGPQ